MMTDLKTCKILLIGVMLLAISFFGAQKAYAVTDNATLQATIAAVFTISITAQSTALTGDDDLADIAINTNDVDQFKFAIRDTSTTGNVSTMINTAGTGAGNEYPFFFYFQEQNAGDLHATIAADIGSNAFPNNSGAAVALTTSFASNQWIFTHISGEAAADTVFDLRIKQSTVAPSTLFSGTYETDVQVQLIDI